jgi:hypothetical protein
MAKEAANRSQITEHSRASSIQTLIATTKSAIHQTMSREWDAMEPSETLDSTIASELIL